MSSAAEDALSERAVDEIEDRAIDLLGIIGERGLLPIVIVDDSDRWLQGEGLPDTRHICAGFFGPVLRMLTELPAGLAIAVHDRYSDMPEYGQADGFLETQVPLPALPDSNALMRLLGKRVAIHADSEPEDIMDHECADALFGYYQGTAAHNLRRMLLAVHTSLDSACEDEAGRIGLGHVQTAIAGD